MKALIKYFASGLLFLIPITATIYVVYWVFSTVDQLVRGPLEDTLGYWYNGLGVLISLAVIRSTSVP